MNIAKDDYDKLPPTLQAKFSPVEGDAGNYTNNEDDPSKLKAALANEREARKGTAKERDALKADQAAKIEKAAAAAVEAARKGGDFAKVEASYQAKIDVLTKRATDAEAQETGRLTRDAVTAAAARIREVFVAPAAMDAYLATRLSAAISGDGQPQVRVLDGQGNPTAATVDDLRKEILANPEFKAILLASKGAGSGATTQPGGGGATSGQKFDASTASTASMVDFLDAKLGQ